MDYTTGYLMGKYELGRSLGQGTFGKVQFARSVETGQSVAIKIINKDKLKKGKAVTQMKHEITSMRMVRHPNIINIYEVMATKTKIYLVIEYAKGGELFERVHKGKLKEEIAHKYFRQLISAVDFCHSKGVYHRDIKLENLLLDANDNLKVTDFGLTAFVKSKRQDGLLHTACGTPAYVSPEVIEQKGYDGVKSDIWSCGVVLFACLAGYLPFQEKNVMDMYRKICRAEFKFPKWFSEDVRLLLIQMLDPKPVTRISIAKIKQSSWFKKDFTLKPPIRDSKSKTTVASAVKIDGNPGHSGTANLASQSLLESIKPTKLDAFGIVFHLHKFDFSGSFEETYVKEERFISREPGSVIISRLIETAKCMRFKIKHTDQGQLNFEAPKVGKMGLVSIDVDIFEVTTALHLVEIRRSNGDAVEYQKMMKEDIRPTLNDIVWAWQGEQHHVKETELTDAVAQITNTGATSSN